jgi:hypothetical protein
VLARIIDARTRAAAWLEPARLGDAVATVVEQARACGAPRLFAASPAGFCVVGATLVADEGLTLYAEGEAERVLLVDVAVASRAGLETAASRLRSVGASDVAIIVVDEHHAGTPEHTRMLTLAR